MPSDPKSKSGDDGGSKDAAVAKTAGFLAFSGIALSILKALTAKPPQPQPQPQPQLQTEPQPKPSSAPLIQTPPQPPIKKPAVEEEMQCGPSANFAARTVEIVRGDTLWGLSRKYGVTIDAIKEANGITGDTIYAGKKLIIP